MNLLTKSLLEDLLENPVTVAIYGGGFKPPTKGHFTVAEKTLEEYPEIDELKIFVGGGVRDGITQEESIKVWDIYKNYLSPKVTVEPSVAPVKSVLGYAKENPTHKVYWVLGAREGDEDDLKDIENRTRSLEKYPNIEVKVITSSGGVSGTKTRQAIKSNNKEEEIWNILKPAVKESKSRAQILKERKTKIEEGFIDNMKTKFQTFLKALKQEGKETKEAVKLLIKAAKGEIELTNDDKEQIGNQLKDILKTIGLVGIATLPGGFIAAVLIKLFKAERFVTPSSFANEGTCGYDTDVKTGKKLNTPGGLEEADPKKGTGKKPEGSGRRLYTDEDPKDTVRIKFKTKEDIVDTLNKKQFKAKSHARQSQVINLIHQRVRAAYGKAKDPEVKSRLKRALDYIESRKESSKKKTERLRKMKEASDPQAGTALPYGSGFAPVKEKNDPFGLNELAKDFVEEVFTETWNPKDSFLSLAVFMKDNGMNVTPLPKIKVISDDEENASHLLGKTAHYNPADKSITLYTFGRHPKDVLRSFAHEMVHHEQNLNGTLGNVSTTNTNEDGHLEELEKEAYQKGNIMFRNWEDSIKNV